MPAEEGIADVIEDVLADVASVEDILDDIAGALEALRAQLLSSHSMVNGSSQIQERLLKALSLNSLPSGSVP